MDTHDMALNSLYCKCKPLVWVVEYLSISEEVEFRQELGCGFIISDGYLITPEHIFPKSKDYAIRTYPVGEKGVQYTATKVLLMPMCDIAILQIHGAVGLKYGELPQDSSLLLGQRLMHIDNNGRLSVGTVSFECGNAATLPNPDDETCKNHVPRFLDVKPSYRVMANVCNSFTCKSPEYPNGEAEDMDCEFVDEEDVHPQRWINYIAKNLYSQTPIIEMNGISCAQQASGTPLFNNKGQIMGIMVFDLGQLSRCGFAIHSSILKEVVKEVQNLPRLSVCGE